MFFLILRFYPKTRRQSLDLHSRNTSFTPVFTNKQLCISYLGDLMAISSFTSSANSASEYTFRRVVQRSKRSIWSGLNSVPLWGDVACSPFISPMNYHFLGTEDNLSCSFAGNFLFSLHSLSTIIIPSKVVFLKSLQKAVCLQLIHLSFSAPCYLPIFSFHSLLWTVFSTLWRWKGNFTFLLVESHFLPETQNNN